MENWSLVSWVISLGLAAWVYVDAQKRADEKAGIWAVLAFCFPWVFGPIFVVFLRGGGKERAKAALRVAEQLQQRHGTSRTAPARQDDAVGRMAAEIADAATPAARADLIRQVGRAWADAVGSDTKAGGMAAVRVLVESAAEATAKGDLPKAQEQMDKALSHVRGGARKHPGGRMILEGLAKTLERGGEAPRPHKAARTPTADLPTAPAVPAVARPAAADVPGFLGMRPAAEAAARVPAEEGHDPRPVDPVPVEPAPAEVLAAPPVRGLPADLAARFREEPLDAVSARVTELARRWIAEVEDRAPGVQRSYARVKLESAASAVFRGDFERAIAMADEAATLVPADGEAAATLRAGLRCAREVRV